MTESLLKEVEHTREKMIKSALQYGYSNVNTIRLSKKLDRLLNVYQLHNTKETIRSSPTEQ